MAAAAEEIDDLSQMLEDLTLNLANGEHRAEVVHINNPHEFYVRPTVYKKYEQIICKPSGKVELDDLILGAQVVFKSKLKGNLIRGEIQNIQESCKDGEKKYHCTIFATDYGFIEKNVSQRRIYNSDGNCIPPLIVECCLSEALPIQSEATWDAKAIDAFKDYIGDDEVVMKVVGKQNGKFLVELSNKYFRDVAEILAMTGYSVLGVGCNKINRLHPQKPAKQHFVYKQLEKDQDIHVRVLSGKSLDHFFVADIKDYEKYLDERETFNYFSKTYSNYLKECSLIVGQTVSVYSEDDSRYYRGIINKVLNPDKIIASLVDTGIKQEVPLSKVKEMSEKFFSTPAVGIYCCAVPEQMHDHTYINLLSPGTKFSIKIVELGLRHDKPNIVKICNKGF